MDCVRCIQNVPKVTAIYQPGHYTSGESEELERSLGLHES